MTCVRDQTLQVGSGTLVLKKLLGWQVSEEHLEDGLSVVTVPGVGVPHHAVAQQRLCAEHQNRNVSIKQRETLAK